MNIRGSALCSVHLWGSGVVLCVSSVSLSAKVNRFIPRHPIHYPVNNSRSLPQLTATLAIIPKLISSYPSRLAQGIAVGPVHWSETHLGCGDGLESRCGGDLISLNWGRCHWRARIRSAPAVGKWHPILTGSGLWSDPHGLIPPQRAAHSPALYLRDRLPSPAFGHCLVLLLYVCCSCTRKPNLFLFLQHVSRFWFLSVFYVHVLNMCWCLVHFCFTFLFSLHQSRYHFASLFAPNTLFLQWCHFGFPKITFHGTDLKRTNFFNFCASVQWKGSIDVKGSS